MDKPKMILFDYGQTLVDEQKFDGVKGSEAVLKFAVRNKYNRSAQELQKAANEINNELGRYNPEKGHLFPVEVPNYIFTNYLYESQGIELSIESEDIDRIFWNAAAPGKPTKGIELFLKFLKDSNIRTGVISNISYCGKVVEDRINDYIPENEFEFVIATSEYMYRKPNKRIFKLALEKAELTSDEVWYVGDNYECDIVGAMGAGIFPVWYVGALHTDYVEKENTLTVKSWQELQRLIEGIMV